MTIDRRAVLLGGAAALAPPARGAPMRPASLVPEARGEAPNYWCTWAAQNYLHGQGAAHLDIAELEGPGGGHIAHEALNERVLFGPGGWADRFHPAARAELFLLLDDGWEAGGTATFLLDETKFPSFRGSPPERLAKLDWAVRARGWRGLALWCRDTPEGPELNPLVGWSKAAGIRYWKIDGGDAHFAADRARDALEAPLTLEHIISEPPLNGDWRSDGRFGAVTAESPRLAILSRTQVYRTYDTTPTLSIPTTLDRVSELLAAAAGRPDIHAILNVEDEPVIAATLGCTMGIMRHPLRGLRPDGDVDLFLAGPRRLKQRMDEVTRAIRWQRLAPPFAIGGTRVERGEALTDSWRFQRGETWLSDAVGRIARQGAPGRLARNASLPEVRGSGGAVPFVIAACFPGGMAAIATLGRASADGRFGTPPADVVWQPDAATRTVAIFGHYRSLRLQLARAPGRGPMFAQDLAGGPVSDIRDDVQVNGREIVLGGALLARLGLRAASAGDCSDPALVLRLPPA